jgi:hypothetical protein
MGNAPGRRACDALCAAVLLCGCRLQPARPRGMEKSDGAFRPAEAGRHTDARLRRRVRRSSPCHPERERGTRAARWRDAHGASCAPPLRPGPSLTLGMTWEADSGLQGFDVANNDTIFSSPARSSSSNAFKRSESTSSTATNSRADPNTGTTISDFDFASHAM